MLQSCPQTPYAYRLGLSTTLALMLTSALFVLPFLSVSQDFGHSHSKDVPLHTHSIGALFVLGLLPYIIVPTRPRFAVCWLMQAVALVLKAAPLSLIHSRAPPFCIS